MKEDNNFGKGFYWDKKVKLKEGVMFGGKSGKWMVLVKGKGTILKNVAQFKNKEDADNCFKNYKEI
jgi:hypothetical protein